MIYYAIVILSVFAAACAQMLLKIGASKQYDSFVHQYLNVWVIGGYCIMFVCMAANIYAMSKGVMVKDVSIIESLSYMFVPMLSFFLFGEKLTWKKVGSIVIIIAGVIVFFI